MENFSERLSTLPDLSDEELDALEVEMVAAFDAADEAGDVDTMQALADGLDEVRAEKTRRTETAPAEAPAAAPAEVAASATARISHGRDGYPRRRHRAWCRIAGNPARCTVGRKHPLPSHKPTRAQPAPEPRRACSRAEPEEPPAEPAPEPEPAPEGEPPASEPAPAEQPAEQPDQRTAARAEPRCRYRHRTVARDTSGARQHNRTGELRGHRSHGIGRSRRERAEHCRSRASQCHSRWRRYPRLHRRVRA